MQRGGEQRCRSADVRADDMRSVQLPLIDQSNDELAHRLRRQEIVPALGSAEAREVDGNQMGVLGELLPDRLAYKLSGQGFSNTTGGPRRRSLSA